MISARRNRPAFATDNASCFSLHGWAHEGRGRDGLARGRARERSEPNDRVEHDEQRKADQRVRKVARSSNAFMKNQHSEYHRDGRLHRFESGKRGGERFGLEAVLREKNADDRRGRKGVDLPMRRRVRNAMLDLAHECLGQGGVDTERGAGRAAEECGPNSTP